MQRPVLAANWKMNHGPSAARATVAAFLTQWAPHTDRTVILFPPALSLTTVVDALGDRTDVSVGVQNVWVEDKGAFTGENSAPMAKEAGARYALVGHSERRHVFGETDAQTGQKCVAAARNGLTPMLCVGELLEEREGGLTEAVVARQLDAVLDAVDVKAAFRQAVVAYEPVWAIGTGRTATPAQAQEVHDFIRRRIAQRDKATAAALRLLYGGSVKGANAAELFAMADIDGGLIGGAALKADEFLTICRAAQGA